MILETFTPLSIYALLGIGLILISLEITLGSFYIIWLGVGFCVVGAVEYFYPFSSFLHQSATALLIAFVLLLLLKKRVKEFMQKSEKEIKDDFLNEKGEGTITHGMLSYKGTLWEIEPKNLDISEGVRVKVIKTKKNVATIELIN